jgi:hypothetical protein
MSGSQDEIDALTKQVAALTARVYELEKISGITSESPWSERHPALLWVAIIAAVLILGGIALRSMKTTAT